MGSHGTLIFFEVSKKFTIALTPLEQEQKSKRAKEQKNKRTKEQKSKINKVKKGNLR